jgi:sporulation protein YlmC with PRC-barrel domain
VLALSELIRRPVLDADGASAGRLRDIAVDLSDPYPRAKHLRVGSRRRGRVIGWENVAAIEDSAIRLRDSSSAIQDSAMTSDELWLVEHVLDVQVIDVASQRLVRAGDVALEVEDLAEVRLAGIEIGWAPVVRRLGLSRLAARARSELIDWRDVHIASGRGHELELATSAARVHHLRPDELEALVARLPAHRAAEVAEAVKPMQVAEKAPAPAPRRRYHHVLRRRRRAPT